jgi:formylglycine-generating enzyme required for sulfatase activity/tRNA A-37 threonylcarbamoyl transferase component Bud32
MTDQPLPDFVRIQGALADRYTIERQIGSGGMATVYLAEDVKHQRKVAVKVLRPELAEAVGSDRFLLEIRTTAQLNHPHILPLLDSGDAGGTLFYVMPFVEGESLRDRLNREQQLPIEDAIAIGADVAAALAYAHGRGIVHRDIKPENIMLTQGEAVVADFGIARAVSAAGGARLTGTGLAVGTPVYMSPEQASASDVDARSDIYSLATVVYEMLAGQPPFTGRNVETIVRQHMMAEPPNVKTIRPTAPDWVAGALIKAMAKTPADRYASATLFATAIKIDRTSPVTGAVAAYPAPPARPEQRTLMFLGMGILTVAIVTGLVWRIMHGTSVAPRAAVGPAGMVLVPGGPYPLFGGDTAVCRNCLPKRTVPLDSFYIDRTEVTVQAYTPYIAARRVSAPWVTAPAADFPVTGVTWSQAQGFCAWRDSLAHLPTEEQWEAAARGKDGRTYAWGNRWDSGGRNAGGERGSVVAVGSYPLGASPVGALDMIGNAWEWTATPGPADPSGGRQYVLRGGAFNSNRNVATTFFRAALPPTVFFPAALPPAVADSLRAQYYDKTGFRCVR